MDDQNTNYVVQRLLEAKLAIGEAEQHLDDDPPSVAARGKLALAEKKVNSALKRLDPSHEGDYQDEEQEEEEQEDE
jgi:hypothetical protein